MADFRFKKGDIVIAKESFVYKGTRVTCGDVFLVDQIDPPCQGETILACPFDGGDVHWYDDKHFDHFNPSCKELDDMMSDFL